MVASYDVYVDLVPHQYDVMFTYKPEARYSNWCLKLNDCGYQAALYVQICIHHHHMLIFLYCTLYADQNLHTDLYL